MRRAGRRAGGRPRGGLLHRRPVVVDGGDREVDRGDPGGDGVGDAAVPDQQLTPAASPEAVGLTLAGQF